MRQVEGVLSVLLGGQEIEGCARSRAADEEVMVDAGGGQSVRSRFVSMSSAEEDGKSPCFVLGKCWVRETSKRANMDWCSVRGAHRKGLEPTHCHSELGHRRLRRIICPSIRGPSSIDDDASDTIYSPQYVIPSPWWFRVFSGLRVPLPYCCWRQLLVIVGVASRTAWLR